MSLVDFPWRLIENSLKNSLCKYYSYRGYKNLSNTYMKIVIETINQNCGLKQLTFLWLMWYVFVYISK